MPQNPSAKVSRMSRSTPINLFLLIAARQERKLVRVRKPTIDGELWLSVAWKPCASDGTCARLDGRDALSNLVYRYINVDRRADDRGNPPNGRVPDRAGGAREGARAT